MKRTNGVLEGSFHEFRLNISEAIRGGHLQNPDQHYWVLGAC